MKEIDLAEPIIDYLQAFHWDVYQEVPCGSGVADILAVLNGRIWTIELKTSLSLQLLDQAIHRCYRSHYVSIGIPKSKKYPPSYRSSAVKTIVDRFGIGIFVIDNRKKLSEKKLSQEVPPSLIRWSSEREIKKILKSLHPKMKKNKAGSRPGNNWTPWKEWKANVEKIVAENPGITPKEMVDKLKSIRPYSKPENAVHAAVYYARSGLIERVTVVKKNNRLHLYPIEPTGTKGKGMWL